ncbi:amino acid adenylation domain-containing protein [Wukongibacter sp. M2B1]|uniref:amino acid adenylation domain-containing protein n=1 Tax=Wukongibacter sp. M2B1 TaxID=3088895 RepID=UPI003D795EAB
MSNTKLDRKNIEDIMALTSTQEGMLFHYINDSNSKEYHQQLSITFIGEVKLELFEKAWDFVIETNEVLRTVYRWENIDKPVQIVLKKHKVGINYLDISHLDASHKKFELDNIRQKDIEKEIDMTRETLRLTVCKLDANKFEMIVSNHHILYDGWSNIIILKELLYAYNCYYNDKYPSKAIKTKFKEFIKWNRALDKDKDKSFWSNYFNDFEIGEDFFSSPYPNKNIKDYKCSISKDITEKLKQFCKDNKISLASVLYCTWGIILNRLNNKDDVVFGTVVSGRNAKIRNIDEVVGLFINTIPLRVKISNGDDLLKLIKKIDTSLRERSEYENTPLVEIKEYCDFKPYQNLFNSIVAIENYPMNLQTEENDVLNIDRYSILEKTNYNMTLEIIPFNDMELQFRYNSKTVHDETIQRIGEYFKNILEIIISDYRARVRDIEILSKDEKNRLLFEFNNTYIDYPRDKTIQEVFEEQVQKSSENIAVVYEDKKLTYRQLNERANSLARILRQKEVKSEAIVGIMGERSLEMIVGILAVLKTGGTYLPIDPQYPLKRIEYMLKDSNAKLLLTQGKYKDKLNFGGQIINIEDEELYDNEIGNLDSINKATDIAYIMYTSGSTGNPKGVMVKHRNVNRLVKYPNYVKFESGDKILQTGSLGFDAATFEIWGALLNGLELYLTPVSHILEVDKLERIIKKSKINIIWLTSPLFNEIANAKAEIFKTIKYLLVGGDVLNPDTINKVMEKCKDTKIVNGYGPTENTTFSTCFQIDKKYKTKIPIGKPINNSRVYILDKNNNLQPINVPGELCVAGDGLAKGYLSRKELTEEKFVENPFESGEKMYKTGDLAKWLPDGNIEFLGRIDHQVKIRGYRVELKEIENTILKEEEIKEVVVIAREDQYRNKYLCAYIVKENEITIEQIRERLTKEIPKYMVPSAFIELEKLPLTVNGKVDRKVLLDMEVKLNRESEYQGPRNEIEVKLVKLYEELLEVEGIGINDNFFDIGGHSLKATILSSRIQRELEVAITVRDIFEAQTIKEIANKIKKKNNRKYEELEPLKTQEYYSTSSAQRRIYTMQMMDKSSTEYNIPFSLKLEGKVESKRIIDAVNKLIQRHEALRTSFHIDGEEIVQSIKEEAAIDLKYVEKLDSNEEEIKDLLNSWVTPFDLEKAPLIRCGLIKMEEEKYILMLDMHHIISDGTTMGILAEDFVKAYAGEALKKDEVQYKEYAAWEAQQKEQDNFQKQREYWKKEYEGEIPVLELPTDGIRGVEDLKEGREITFEIEEKVIKDLKNKMARMGGTLYMGLMAGFSILLSKYSGMEDIIVGMPIAGRRHSQMEKIAGMFVNTLTIRTSPNAEKKTEEYLKEVKEKLLKAYDNQEYPYEELIEEIGIKRDINRNPLFDAMLVLQNTEMKEMKLENIKMSPYKIENNRAKFDITLLALEVGNKLSCNINYKSKLYEKETIKRMIGHYKKILEEIALEDNKEIKEIEFIAEAEKKQILEEFNYTSADYPRDKTIQELFEAQVERTPNNIAVMYEGKCLTYRQLNEKANSLANSLRQNAVKPEAIVGIVLERSIDMIVGILAVLKAGGAYLPIDIVLPEKRIEYMIKDSGSQIVLTNSRSLSKINGYKGKIIDIESEKIYDTEKDNLEVINGPDNLAYVIYTSGSTGEPKGVMIEHRSLVNYVWWSYKNYMCDTKNIIPLYTSISFDLTITSIFPPLISGNTIEIYGDEKGEIVLHRILKDNRASIVKLTPTHLKLIKEISNQDSSIERLIVGGENLNTRLAEDISHSFGGNVEIINEYGPTEATVGCTIYKYRSGENSMTSVPIGKAGDNVNLYILDRTQKPVPIGVIGELYISGEGLARGYLNRKELTKEKFINNPFNEEQKMYKTGDLARWLTDGNIEFLGRIDHQVKIRGYRIEIGEIEKAILKCKGIKETVVTSRKDKNGDNYLCAYIVKENRTSTEEIKEILRNELPEYMVPSAFIELENIPLNTNGKVDMKILQDIEVTINRENNYEGPRNEIEIRLIKLWEDLLEVEEIGINDNFFDIGGHSLKATILSSRIQKEFKVEVAVRDIFKFSTVKELARYINAMEPDVYLSIEKVEKKEFYPTSSAQKRLFILWQLEKNSIAYNMPGAMIIEGDIDKQTFEKVFKDLIKRHETLRTSFKLVDGEPVQYIADKVDFEVNYMEASKDRLGYVTEEFVEAFDLTDGPLLRVGLVKFEDKRHLFLFDIHHIVCDGVSMSILIDDFIKLLNNEKLSDMKIQYKDYTIWQNNLLNTEFIKKQEDYWLSTFRDEIPILDFPTDYPRTSYKNFEGDKIHFTADMELTFRLKNLAVKTGTTMYMILLASLNILLSKYGNQEDIVIGTPIAGRNHVDLENVIGMFVNTLAMRNYPTKEKTFSQFLNEVKENSLMAYDNQDYQFETLVEKLGIPRNSDRNPLFDVVFALENNVKTELNTSFAKFIPYELDNRTAKFDITLHALENRKEVEFCFEYCTRLFKKNTIDALARDYIDILDSITKNLDIKLKDIKLNSNFEPLEDVLEDISFNF